MKSKSQNPQVVLDQIIAADGTKVGKLTIKPVTIYRYAWLDKVKSPFLYSDQEFSLDGMIPSIFILANDRDVLKQYANDIEGLKQAAMDFCDDNLTVQDLPVVIKLVVDELTKLNTVAPSQQQGDDSKKKA